MKIRIILIVAVIIGSCLPLAQAVPIDIYGTSTGPVNHFDNGDGNYQDTLHIAFDLSGAPVLKDYTGANLNVVAPGGGDFLFSLPAGVTNAGFQVVFASDFFDFSGFINGTSPTWTFTLDQGTLANMIPGGRQTFLSTGNGGLLMQWGNGLNTTIAIRDFVTSFSYNNAALPNTPITSMVNADIYYSYNSATDLGPLLSVIVPEPGAVTLLVVGGMAVGAQRRRWTVAA